MATLSDAQLGQIAERIFVTRDRNTTKLPTPASSGSARFKAALDSIALEPDFKDAGIGVIDFTDDASNPDIWLHNPGRPFRIGSASKIAMLLSAVQLRFDVRNILGLNIISSAADLEAVFANRKLWRMAKPPQAQVAPIAATPPLISKIFDFGKDPVDFAGSDPNGRRDIDLKPVAAVQDAIVDRLPVPANPSGVPELRWERWRDFTFSERLWMTGCMSDNVAATTCVSQIGQPYIKAVLRSYGLYDASRGMHLFPSYGYGPSAPATSPGPRPLLPAETIVVKDVDRATGRLINQRSWVPGSAAALVAYMLALVGNNFAEPGDTLTEHLAACETIQRNLADDGPHAVASNLLRGVKSTTTTVNKEFDKIGLLQAPREARVDTFCEFVYVETEEQPAPPRGRTFMKYAVVGAGLHSGVGAGAHAGDDKSVALGALVHKALLTL
jgi:hypothetical protein